MKTIKERLENLRRFGEREKVIKEKISDIYYSLGMSAPSDNIGRGRNSVRYNNQDLSWSVSKIEEYEKYLLGELRKLNEEKLTLQKLVDEKLDGVEWEIINKYYLNGRRESLEKVSVDINYSYIQTKRLFKKALGKLDSI